MEEKLLYSSTDSVKADYICSVLKENNIPFVKKMEGAGEYLNITTGNLLNNSIEILVSEEDYNKADELLKNINETTDNTQTENLPKELKNITQEEEKETETQAQKTKDNLKLFIICFIFVPIAIAVIVGIINIILYG